MTSRVRLSKGSPWLRRLTSSDLASNVAAVASGAVAGQAVAFVLSPLITRIYSPEVFGLQGLFLSLVSILSPVVALRYPMAIVVAESEADAGRIARLSILIAFFLSLLLGVALAVARGPILTLMAAESLGTLVWFLPLALFCVALQDVADYRAARLGRFRLVGIVTVVQAFATNLARVLGGLIAPVAGVLVTITSIAPATQALLLTLGDRHPRTSAPGFGRYETLALLKKHANFPLYRVPTDVLNAASQSVPVIMLAALFSPAAAGLYVLTRGVLNLPANLIGTAVGNVIYARYAELDRAGRPLTPLLFRATLALLAIGPFIVGATWFAPPVFALVFGEEWREAGLYARWMGLWISLMVANIPATRIVPVIGRQKIFLVYNMVLLAVRIIAVLAAAHFTGDALTAVAWFSLSSVAMICLSILIFYQFTVAFDRKIKDIKYD